MKYSCLIKNTAYEDFYLNDVMGLTELVFENLNDQAQYNIYEVIDSYFQTSERRCCMDIGIYDALDSGHLQMLKSIDYSICKEDNIKLSKEQIKWLADITVYTQWRFCFSSKMFNERCNTKELLSYYEEYKNKTLEITAKMLFEKYVEPNYEIMKVENKYEEIKRLQIAAGTYKEPTNEDLNINIEK